MIYTAITNNFHQQRNDIKCFSEDILNNPRLSSKIYKVLSHVYDPDEWSIWVDGDIFIPEDKQKELVEELKISGKEIGAFKHPWRNCIYEEANVVIQKKLDDKIVVEEQMKRYRKEGYPNHNGMYMCGILVRKHTEKIKLLNECWWREVTNGSSRDQLSFPYIFRDCHTFKGNGYDYHKKRPVAIHQRKV